MASHGPHGQFPLHHAQTQDTQPPCQQGTSKHQKRYSRMDNEPETPVPSIYTPVLEPPGGDKVTQRVSPGPITTILDNNHGGSDTISSDRANASFAGATLAAAAPLLQTASTGEFSGSTQVAALPYVTSLHELSAVSLQYLPTFSSSPAKLNHLQGLMSSLHKIMNDQSFAMGDLRTQINEIQEVLNRVSPKQDNMTIEERQILQNAQVMKNLAEEVITTNQASEPRRSMEILEQPIQDGQPSRTLPLTISVPALNLRTIDPTEAPPPTATTPPTGAAFQTRPLRHRSSTASFTSSANSDRQYTQDSEERSSRPSSVASSYRRHQKSKSRQSLRQLEPLNNGKGSRYEAESNAAFDRICSLLTDMITDASTAVSTAPDGSKQSSNIPLPQFSPLVQSDSESSADSASDGEGAEDSNGVEGDQEDMRSSKHVEDPFLRRLQGPEGAQNTHEGEVEVELEPVDRYRTGIRSRLDKPSKRLSSLFMELQNTQPVLDAAVKDEQGRRRSPSEVGPVEELAKENITRRPRHSISSMSISSVRSSRPNSICWTMGKPTDNPEPVDSCESAPESPLVSRRPRHRDSISSLRSEPVQRHYGDNKAQQLITQRVDAELDRTVDTIDGLTRDLVAVATHQNWMQMRLQKTLQFQKEQIQQIERAHSSTDVASLSSIQTSVATENDHAQLESPLADLSKSLKQVAVSVGKVLANSASNTTHRRNQSTAQEHPDHEKSTGKPRFSGKDFSRYFQELEKIAALGGMIGFSSKGDEDFLEESLNQDSKGGSSGSNYAKSSSGNGSYRSSSVTLVDEAIDAMPVQQGCGDSEPAKDGAPLSQSRRGSASAAPPELEDFAAQCRLLTRALVLPFVQLTHHAMTSQDSALALAPRSRTFSDPTQDLDSTLEIVEDLEISQRKAMKTMKLSTGNSHTTKAHESSMTASSKLDPRNQKGSIHSSTVPSPLPSWSSSMAVAGRDLDSILKAHGGELSPDAMVKAKAFISTGLYLLHLLYWTVLFVIGTIVLDPWLAETAGQQVVRIVEQVREAIVKDNAKGRGTHTIDQQPQFGLTGKPRSVNMQNDHVTLDPFGKLKREQTESNLEDGRIQALEDRAIEVAVGFETFKHSLSTPNRPVKDRWGSQDNFQSTAEAPTLISAGAQHKLDSTSQTTSPSATDASKANILRTVTWAGPRRRRPTRDGAASSSRVRRFSNARNITVAVPAPTSISKSESVPTIAVRRYSNTRRERPLSHWGFFGPTTTFNNITAAPYSSATFSGQERTELDSSRMGAQTRFAVQQLPQLTVAPISVPTLSRRKSF